MRLGFWGFTCAGRGALFWPGLLMGPFCWALHPEASLSQAAFSPWVNFSLKVALDPLKVHKTPTSNAWPWQGGGKHMQFTTFSGSTVTTGNAN